MKTFSDLHKVLSLLQQDYPHIRGICICQALSDALIPYVSLLFGARILGFLTSGLYRSAGETAAILVFFSLALGLVFKLTDARIEAAQYTMRDSLSRQLADKAYIMDYDLFEQTETMDRIRDARNWSWGSGGIDMVLYYYIAFVHDLFSVCFALVFIARLLMQSLFFLNHLDVTFWLLVLGLILNIMTGFYASKRVGQIDEEVMSKNVRNNAVSSYLLTEGARPSNKKDMTVYGMGPLILGRYKREKDVMTGMYLNGAIRSGRFLAISSFTSNVYAAMGYIHVGLRAVEGVFPVSDVLLYTGALQRFSTALQGVLSNYISIRSRMGYMMRFYDFLHQATKRVQGTYTVDQHADNRCEVEFRDVSFTYPGTDVEVLSHINLSLHSGCRTALVGRNGAGKSTIVKLLCGLYEPSCGVITLNGINIQNYRYDSYVSLIAPVFQDFQLLSLSVRDNITGGNERDKTDDAVWQALQIAGIKDRVREMEDGLDTLLYHDNGEGIDLSGGEAQRIAIARAFYKNASILVLDEPTAALDPLTEAEIYQKFNDLIGTKAAVYISHRMSSCKFCDEIIVLKEGRIIEQGTHENLVKQNGEYALLYNTQTRYYV